MLYASTRAAVRREFGDNLIADELYGSNKVRMREKPASSNRPILPLLTRRGPTS